MMRRRKSSRCSAQQSPGQLPHARSRPTDYPESAFWQQGRLSFRRRATALTLSVKAYANSAISTARTSI